MEGQTVTYEKLLDYTKKILVAQGYPNDRAEICAKTLVEADARGVSSHGVARLGWYQGNVEKGFTVPDAELEVVHETPVSVVVDAHHGIGAYAADFAMKKCVEKAKTVGTGFAAVRESNHFGMAGFWAEMAAENDQIGMAFTNTRPCSIATFGRQRILGTNPICISIPQDGKIPFLLDMSTTTVAHGKIEVYERRDKEMPEGWAVDERGIGTTDVHLFQKLFRSDLPHGGHLFLGGETEDLGGHKGYGLGLLVDLLCAGPSLGRWSLQTFKGTGSGIAHFFGAISLDIFGSATEIKKHVAGILEEIRNTEKAEGQDRIYIHGEKEAEAREKSIKEGLFLDAATCELLENYGKEHDLDSLF